MRHTTSLLLAVTLLTAAGSAAAAQQALPPVRSLGAVTKVSPADLLGSVSTVRPLPDGTLSVTAQRVPCSEKTCRRVRLSRCTPKSALRESPKRDV